MEDNNNNNSNNEQKENKQMNVDEVQDYIVKTVNAAITTHMSRQNKKIESTIAESLASFAEQFKPPVAEEPKQDSELENKMKAMHAQLQEERQRLEEERQQRKIMEERTALQNALSESGVGPTQMSAAMALLYDAEKRVSRDEAGNLQFAMPEKGYTDYLSLQEGVSKFLKTDQGKMFQAPRDVNGSGNTGGKPPTSRGGDKSLDDMPNRDLLRIFGEALEKGSADY